MEASFRLLQSSSIRRGIAVLVVVAAMGPVRLAWAGACACEADVVAPFGGATQPDFNDLIAVEDCVLGGPCICTPSCDVNCDGEINDNDVAAASCRLQQRPPEECCAVLGGCCIDGVSCAVSSQAACEDPPPAGAGGCYFGDNTECATQNAAIFPEGGGTVFVHVIGPPIDCTGGCGGGVASAQSTAACTGSGPYTDPWVSTTNAQMCHNFGSVDTDPIPADFFGPGSDPFTDIVCLEGVPLGGGFGDADTIITRTADPFERCDVPGATQQTVDIEITELSLVGVDPITVTFNGGQDPEEWTVVVDLSPSGLLPATPQGTLTATKTHCNGGTYTADLYVQPRFTFTGPGGTEVLDTFVADTPAIQLEQLDARPWTSEVDPILGLQSDPCTFFHPNIEDTNQQTLAECDQDLNGVLDICQIPAASEWGLLVLAIGVLAGGSIVLRRKAVDCC